MILKNETLEEQGRYIFLGKNGDYSSWMSLTSFGQGELRRKWLQYFVVPNDAFNVLPSTCTLFTAWIARNESSALWYVTYALALGPYTRHQNEKYRIFVMHSISCTVCTQKVALSLKNHVCPRLVRPSNNSCKQSEFQLKDSSTIFLPYRKKQFLYDHIPTTEDYVIHVADAWKFFLSGFA